MLEFSDVRKIADDIINNVEKVIIGKREQIKLILLAIFSSGHVLLEDVPGVGKTMLARAMACSLGCSFKRIQFTPDLLPSDIIGVSIYNQESQKFEFHAGPIVSQVVLADEINRAAPKTQSSLLEGMEERQISLDGLTRNLPEPFIVMATQNSIEYEGTYPLPKAQMDRFLMKVNLGYPEQEVEEEILVRQKIKHPIEELRSVIDAESLLKVQKKVKEIHISDKVRKYIVNITQKTRLDSRFGLGVSPRGSIALFKTSQALASIEGRDYVLPDDVKKIAIPCLAHRLFFNYDNMSLNKNEENLLQELIEEIEVPIV